MIEFHPSVNMYYWRALKGERRFFVRMTKKNSPFLKPGRFQNVISTSERLKSSFFKNITSKMPS
ncbi:hypothetical protein QKW52_22820 [Bacillus sonorensis]|nr:hypothetical protein [Bacillus sonorensis]